MHPKKTTLISMPTMPMPFENAPNLTAYRLALQVLQPKL
jgi:hypothetical protein